MIDLILIIVVLSVLIIGTITDFKTREVPDWINFGLIFSGIGIRLIYSSFSSDWKFLLEGIFGLVIFIILGYMMYYTGQWGGGDSKLLMGMGAALGFQLRIDSLMIIFLVNALFAGAAYGIVYSIVLAITNWKNFHKELKNIIHEKKMLKLRKKILMTTITLLVLGIFFIKEYILLLLYVLLIAVVYISFYLIIFVKAVEKSAMHKKIDPHLLTEGEWILKEYRYKGEYLCGPKDLGITKEQISRYLDLYEKGKIGKIEVKYGIPFVPSFLIAFIITLMLGPWWI